MEAAATQPIKLTFSGATFYNKQENGKFTQKTQPIIIDRKKRKFSYEHLKDLFYFDQLTDDNDGILENIKSLLLEMNDQPIGLGKKGYNAKLFYQEVLNQLFERDDKSQEVTVSHDVFFEYLRKALPILKATPAKPDSPYLRDRQTDANVTERSINRKNFFKSKAATRIQATAKMLLARASFQKLKTKVVRPITRFQAAARIRLARARAATTIQTAFRKHHAQASFQTLKTKVVSAITRFQAAARIRLARVRAATRIQATARMLPTRRAFEIEVMAITRIQAAARMLPTRRAFLKSKAAITRIQAAAKMHLAQASFLKLKAVISRIQAAFKKASSTGTGDHYYPSHLQKATRSSIFPKT